MSEWCDIATAPKDGTYIIAWDGVAVVGTHWDEMLEEWDGYALACEGYPVKWKPMPEPPE